MVCTPFKLLNLYTHPHPRLRQWFVHHLHYLQVNDARDLHIIYIIFPVVLYNKAYIWHFIGLETIKKYQLYDLIEEINLYHRIQKDKREKGGWGKKAIQKVKTKGY